MAPTARAAADEDAQYRAAPWGSSSAAHAAGRAHHSITNLTVAAVRAARVPAAAAAARPGPTAAEARVRAATAAGRAPPARPSGAVSVAASTARAVKSADQTGPPVAKPGQSSSAMVRTPKTKVAKMGIWGEGGGGGAKRKKARVLPTTHPHTTLSLLTCANGAATTQAGCTPFPCLSLARDDTSAATDPKDGGPPLSPLLAAAAARASASRGPADAAARACSRDSGVRARRTPDGVWVFGVGREVKQITPRFPPPPPQTSLTKRGRQNRGPPRQPRDGVQAVHQRRDGGDGGSRVGNRGGGEDIGASVGV